MGATNPPRDAITQDSSGKASPKRADLLNGKPSTKSAGSAGPNFTKKDNPRSSWPVPNSPYGD